MYVRMCVCICVCVLVCVRVFQAASMTAADIDEVVMVGGSSRIPKVLPRTAESIYGTNLSIHHTLTRHLPTHSFTSPPRSPTHHAQLHTDIREYFGGKPPRTDIDPDMAVALGAARVLD